MTVAVGHAQSRTLRGGVEEDEFLKVFSVEAAVAGEEPVTLDLGVRGDDEIGHHPDAGATVGAVVTPGLTGEGGGVGGERIEAHADTAHRGLELGTGREITRGLGPDGVAGHYIAFLKAPLQNIKR